MNKISAALAVAMVAVSFAVQADNGTPDPAAVATDLMAQFYGVSTGKVSAEVLDQSSRAAKVVARAPGGHECRFAMARAPAGLSVPSGWLVAGTACAPTTGQAVTPGG